MGARADELNEEFADRPESARFFTTVRSIFVGWEMLRPVYVLLLAAWCLLLLLFAGSDADTKQFWGTCIIGGIFANLCYFAGPLVEGYVAWLGWRHHVWLRPVLFCLGLLFTMALALGAHSKNLMPGFD